MQRRKYSKEFKQEMVELTLHTRVSVGQIARELGINANMRDPSRRKLDERKRSVSGGRDQARDEEMARLWREPSRVKKERDLLRQAEAFFGSKSR